jgi:hypothetical protein
LTCPDRFRPQPKAVSLPVGELKGAPHARELDPQRGNGSAAEKEAGSGAPLRLRVERQIGYKMAKYLRRIARFELRRHRR